MESFKGSDLILFLFWTLVCCCCCCCEGKVVVNADGGYEDLIVSISKDVPPIACQQLLLNIQNMFASGSEYLHGGTDGRVYFSRIVIVIPRNWDALACGRSNPVTSFTSRGGLEEADFRIGSDHPIFGSEPWTQQSRGCGLKGDFVSLPVNYVLHFNESENSISGNTNQPSTQSIPTDRLLVREWSKYRYGVFDEIGFPSDPIYPISYLEDGELKPTSCSNRPLLGNWSPECDETNSEQVKKGCRFIASPEQNDLVTSSILSFPQLQNVNSFCDQNTHNSKAPTKQNFICQGKSVSEVVYSHTDFTNLPKRERPVPVTKFVVKQITAPRFVLLVEETGNMNLRDVWKFLKLAVRKFIKYDLSLGSEIGLMSFSSSEVKVLSNMTSLHTLSDRRALADKLPNYPNIDSGANISLRRGIFQAVQLLKSNEGRAGGSVIILVSQGTVSNPDLEASLELMKREDVTLAAIEYPSVGDGRIGQLAEGTNGPYFSIRETGVGPTTHMSTFVQLINAFMEIQRYFTQDLTPTWPLMIHEGEYKGDSRSYVEANFSFESSGTQSPADFFIYTSNPNDPKINSVELTSPTGLKYTTQLSDLHDINVIKVDAVINQSGVWKYRIDRLADSHQSHFVQVVSRTSEEDLRAHLYSNMSPDKVVNLTVSPLILYVQVTKGGSGAVVDADVEAEIVAGNKKWTLPLLDNGNGDGDITGGDGIYSRYFLVPAGVTSSQLQISARVQVNPYRARYIVPLTNQSQITSTSPPIQSLCCGSRMTPTDPKSQYKILPFGERRTNSLKMRITGIPPKGFYNPGRIGDLKLNGIDDGSRNVSLVWTAPGEELDQGVPASYQIFYSSLNRNENWLLLSEMKGDLEAGVVDNVTLTFPSYGTFLVAIRAVDFSAKPGKMSNIIQVLVQEPAKEPESSLTSLASGSSSLSINTTPSSPKGDFSKFDLFLIIICGLAFVLLLGGLIVTLLYCRRVGSSQRKAGTKSGTDTKISAITDPKSPIHWSASELLGEHEKGNPRNSIYGTPHSKPDHNIIIISPGMNQQQQEQMNEMNGKGGGYNAPMHLNILASDYEGTNSSTRSRSSPDSYDDPDCPTPIPVSVRHTSRPGASDYSTDNNVRNSNYGGFCPHAHYQVPAHLNNPNNFTNISNGGLPAYPNNSGRYSMAHNSSPLPPPPPHLQHQLQNGHPIHYDPDIQGSMTSVNSKKRNITMV